MCCTRTSNISGSVKRNIVVVRIFGIDATQSLFYRIRITTPGLSLRWFRRGQGIEKNG
jgi:hypothetical protein